MPVTESSDVKTRWLTPGVAGIGTASLLSDAGHEIPTALLPSFLTSTLGAPAAALGAIEGVSDALAGVARFGGGALADDPERRRTVAVGGYATTAVLSAGIGAASTPLQAAVLRAGAWTARGLRVPARNALLADVVPASLYGRAYGFERAMDNLGAIVGPLLAIGLVGTVGVRWAIGLSVIPGLLAALAIVYAIRHTAAPAIRTHRPIRLQIRPVLRGRLGRLMAGPPPSRSATVPPPCSSCGPPSCSHPAAATTTPPSSPSPCMSPTTWPPPSSASRQATTATATAPSTSWRPGPLCSPAPTSGSPPDPAASPCSHRPSSSLASGSAAPRQPNTPRSPNSHPKNPRFGLRTTCRHPVRRKPGRLHHRRHPLDHRLARRRLHLPRHRYDHRSPSPRPRRKDGARAVGVRRATMRDGRATSSPDGPGQLRGVPDDRQLGVSATSSTGEAGAQRSRPQRI